METFTNFFNLFSQINWLWYIISVIVIFVLGAIWYSLLFKKNWIRVFKIDIPEKEETLGTLFTMSIQFIVTAFLGLLFFVLVPISLLIALFVLVSFCGWQKATLKFRYTIWKDYIMAALIEVGYTFIAGILFILFALL